MSSFVRSGWGLITRHKKKFIASAVVVGGGVCAYYYAKRLFAQGMQQVEEMGKQFQDTMVEQQLREGELERVRSECSDTVLTFVPPLRKQLNKCTDPRPVTLKLKERRTRSKSSKSAAAAAKTEGEAPITELWDELKVISLTRLIASVYGLVLLDLLLRLQMHVMARTALTQAIAEGRKHLDGAEAEGPPPSKATEAISPAVRERFLFVASHQLVSSGLGGLVERIRGGVATASKSWKMGTDATVPRGEVLEMVRSIRREVEAGGAGAEGAEAEAAAAAPSENAADWLLRCFLAEGGSTLQAAAAQSGSTQLSAEELETVKTMVDEVLDMMESPNFRAVLGESVDAAFDLTLDEVRSRPFAEAPPVKAKKGKFAPPPVYFLTKVIVSLKQAASDVLTGEAERKTKRAGAPPSPKSGGAAAAAASGGSGGGGGGGGGGGSPKAAASVSPDEELCADRFVRALDILPEAQRLFTDIFNQDAPEGMGDALGLDGLDGETLKSLTSLLASFDQGGAGGADGAMPAGLAALMGGGGGNDAAGTGLAELMGMPLPGAQAAPGGNVPH